MVTENPRASFCFVNVQDVTDQICSQLAGYPQIRLDVFAVFFLGELSESQKGNIDLDGI